MCGVHNTFRDCLVLIVSTGQLAQSGHARLATAFRSPASICAYFLLAVLSESPLCQSISWQCIRNLAPFPASASPACRNSTKNGHPRRHETRAWRPFFGAELRSGSLSPQCSSPSPPPPKPQRPTDRLFRCSSPTPSGMPRGMVRWKESICAFHHLTCLYTRVSVCTLGFVVFVRMFVPVFPLE